MTSNQENEIEELDRRLIETDDPNEKARIYLRAAQLYCESAQTDEACFFMTQAFVFAVHHGNKAIEQQARRFLMENDRI